VLLGIFAGTIRSIHNASSFSYMRILILGAGAIGGYFAAQLFDKGVDVTLLVRKATVSKLVEEGIRVQSPLGNLQVHPSIISEVNPTDEYDLVMITCKTFHLQGALQALRPLNKSAYILPLLNGISHYSILQNYFGKERILGGFAHLSTTRDEQGTILHLNNAHVLMLGQLDSAQQTLIKQLQQEIAPVAPYLIFSTEIMQAIWQKLIFISTAAAATSLMNTHMGAIAATDLGATCIAQSFELNCQAASFAGHAPDETWKKNTLKDLLHPTSTLTASLLRDMQKDKPIEVSILGDMLQANRAAHLRNDLLALAYLKAEIYQQRLDKATP